MNCICLVCGFRFYRKPYIVNHGGGKYCGRGCKNQFQRGKPSKTLGKPNRLKGSLIKTRRTLVCVQCKTSFITYPYREDKARFCKNTCFFEWRRGRELSSKGRRLSPEHRAKLSGKNANNWQGGVTPENERLRKTIDYALWRTAVFLRDDYTCQMCHTRGGSLHADHIKPFAFFPELRLAIDNGRTLCESCHKKTDTYGGRALRYGRPRQIINKSRHG